MQRRVVPEEPPARWESSAEWIGLAAGLAGVIVFGLTLPMTRYALTGFDRYVVGIGRAIPAAILAAAILALTRQPFPARRHWPGLAIVAAGVVFGFPVLATAAMQYAPAAHGGVILAVLPLATAMAGAVMAGERPSRGFWIAGIAGSLMVLAFAMVEAGGIALEAADLLLAAAIVAAAVGYAQSGVLARAMGGWQVISWALVFSLPWQVLALALFAEPVNWAAPPRAWLGFLYVSLMSQFFGFFFWNTGMALAGVARTGQLQLLQPFVTLIASVLLLGENVGWRHGIFALAVVAIVMIGRQLRVERPRRS
jgi:drug/metabolite transporter (DMT)-like permease